MFKNETVQRTENVCIVKPSQQKKKKIVYFHIKKSSLERASRRHHCTNQNHWNPCARQLRIRWNMMVQQRCAMTTARRTTCENGSPQIWTRTQRPKDRRGWPLATVSLPAQYQHLGFRAEDRICAPCCRSGASARSAKATNRALQQERSAHITRTKSFDAFRQGQF